MKKSKNEVKNEVKEKKMPEGVKFSSEYQPDPDAKKAGWDRKRRRDAIMELVDKYSGMSYEELKGITDDIEKNPQNYTVDEVRILQYTIKSIKKDSMLIDFLDRHVSKAPQEVDVKSNGVPISGFVFEVIDKTEDIKKDDSNNSNNKNIQANS